MAGPALMLACALDIATFYRLPLLGAGEANPPVAALGPLAVVAKINVAAAIVVATGRIPYFAAVAAIGAAWWGFGALVNFW